MRSSTVSPFALQSQSRSSPRIPTADTLAVSLPAALVAALQDFIGDPEATPAELVADCLSAFLETDRTTIYSLVSEGSAV